MQSAPETVAVIDKAWATFVPDRRPSFKTHNTLGQAKNAVINISRYRSNVGFTEDMVIYKLRQDGQYMPWLKIAQGTYRNDYKELAEKPQSKNDKLGEINRLERSMRFHELEAERLRKEIAARRLELDRT